MADAGKTGEARQKNCKENKEANLPENFTKPESPGRRKALAPRKSGGFPPSFWAAHSIFRNHI
ncbi:hypothetical protein [Succinimonas sp.]|uniref:hypothetical protein n=1 Tax=Succinimonas sp. TaxID=1936151 RepID=UPI00386C8050